MRCKHTTKNIIYIFIRDVKRILRVPEAVLVVIFLCLLPSLYAWLNIIGFWNPYENTGNLHVCVVNEDEVYSDEMFPQLFLGKSIVEALSENDKFDWEFTDRDTAMQELYSGDAYAVFIIPPTFSGDVASLFSGNLDQPKLEYYVNEKISPVSPKITDTGADMLETTINDTFVSVVSSIVASEINQQVLGFEEGIDASQSYALSKIDSALISVGKARTSVQSLTNVVIHAQDDISAVKTSVENTKTTLNKLSSDLSGASKSAQQTSLDVVTFLIDAGTVMDSTSLLVSQLSTKTNVAIGQTTGAFERASSSADICLDQAQVVIDENKKILEILQDMIDSMPEGDEKDALLFILKDIESENEESEKIVSSLDELNEDIKNSSGSISQASKAFDDAIQSSLNAMNTFRMTFSKDSLPKLSEGVYSLGATVQELSGIVARQAELMEQVIVILDELKATLVISEDSLRETDQLLDSTEDMLSIIRTDIAALNMSDSIMTLSNGMKVSPEEIAAFMLSPTEVTQEELYPINSYGSAMAPLFINLTLWIGAFMLMVIIRLEVDSTGLRNVTISQRYIGRGILLSFMSMAQAIICCMGCLIIGVQVINIPMFYITAVLCSLAYLSIQYALSSTLQHVGKALCVILVFVQIPGATGLYPIEMTPDFFQTIYPLFPFTSGINAIRETTCGFYGHEWLNCISILLAFFVASILIGILTRPYVTNLNRLFAREIMRGDIINGETVELPEQHFKRSELIQLLSNREEYQELVRVKAARFIHSYPQIKHGFVIIAAAVSIVGTVLCVLLGAEKVVVLTLWLIWAVTVISFMIVLEYLKDHFARQLAFRDLSDDEIHALYVGQNTIESIISQDAFDGSCDYNVKHKSANFIEDKPRGKHTRTRRHI